MASTKEANIAAVEEELVQLRRDRGLYDNNPGWSLEARKIAVARIDQDIAAKKAELSRLRAL